VAAALQYMVHIDLLRHMDSSSCVTGPKTTMNAVNWARVGACSKQRSADRAADHETEAAQKEKKQHISTQRRVYVGEWHVSDSFGNAKQGIGPRGELPRPHLDRFVMSRVLSCRPSCREGREESCQGRTYTIVNCAPITTVLLTQRGRR
jgi:hypothetical protein